MNSLVTLIKSIDYFLVDRDRTPFFTRSQSDISTVGPTMYGSTSTLLQLSKSIKDIKQEKILQ